MPKSQLYLQTREHILKLIRQIQPGEQLPSEASLSQRLGVSRNTIRDALMSLEQDGIVVRRHGIGTFVAASPHHLRTSLNRILPIPELITASGFKHKIRDLKIGTLVGPSEAHQLLGVPPTEKLASVTLLHLADTRPAVYITYWLHPTLRADQVRWDKFDGHMQNFLERYFHLRIHRSYVRIHAVKATRELAAKLRVKPSSPLLKLTHVAYTLSGQAVYCSTSYQDSELLEVTVVRQRK
ncbi:MAG: GntR family transcriptional regulator [Anaerolineae bacterium]|nr:GntR family transcriptional regulator [Anaerolineae bacterium]